MNAPICVRHRTGQWPFRGTHGFQTGYDSGWVEVDHAFVTTCEDLSKVTLACVIIRLAHALGVVAIAEGAETPGELVSWILALLVTAARAGCVEWGADDDAALSASPLAVTGTVRDLDISGDEIRQHVEVDRAWRGEVRSGWITLVSYISRTSCPGTRMYPIGERVFAIGALDDAGELGVSPCEPTTGRYIAGRSRVEGVTGDGDVFAGSAPVVRRGSVAAFPAPGADRVRLVRAGRLDLGGEVHAGDGTAWSLEGRVISEGGGRVRAVWDLDLVELAGAVDVADLERVPVRTVELAPGVHVAGGTSLRWVGESAIYAENGVSVAGTLPADAAGHRWRPAALPDVADGLGLARDAAWTATPGGPAVGTLTAGGSFALEVRGAAAEGWIPVRIGAPGLLAEGWLPADAVVSAVRGTHTMEGAGGVGGWPMIDLPAGAAIAALDAAVTFARTTGPVTLPALGQTGDRAWVVVDSPWGPIPGEVVVPVP